MRIGRSTDAQGIGNGWLMWQIGYPDESLLFVEFIYMDPPANTPSQPGSFLNAPLVSPLSRKVG
ncbi:MAG TPA: hypothetical protein DCQ26_06745 [Marinilabiliales bacterium]|nr:MAG: hypothetical protein A2W95_11620 [Bacteroidetes bacterium GWA2_40_14]OFX59852.1 MAG: hypothetical protein A2W84_06625 [Bacteroidetes bacterium GWC2_40_13]OFX71588.1 MAG: hypothetical protein A2W96_10610 [Bacteroidetes bacterium GWD2_40_43]OFX95622.1 MAG: hypothetical protein A2W97_00930 [Bacteroidetes bacterium GWE2_40_63]OFY22220.1 MAG: hypothetical protein A2W88_06795 [Bacteroidetes bacterium GWF2_40_13]OFZ24859.1 MAG: hypothetical protein A2437_14430 [Bacteroidetes bacterium RIFOXYC